MMRPSRQHALREGHWLALLGLGLMLLAGCQAVFVPWDRFQAQRESQGEAEPVLVRLATCWAGLPLAQELTTAFAQENPHLSVDVVSSTSGVVLAKVQAGEVDLSLVDQTWPPENLDRGLEARILAWDGVGIVVAQGAALRELTRQQLADLFAGHYLNWSELGAGSGPPELVVLAESAGPQRAFQQAVMQGEKISSAAVVMPHERAVADYVASHPRAVGILSLGHQDGRLRWVAVDGILPTPATLRTGRYPLQYPLVLVRAQNLSAEALRFFAFATGAKGRRLIEQRYALPR